MSTARENSRLRWYCLWMPSCLHIASMVATKGSAEDTLRAGICIAAGLDNDRGRVAREEGGGFACLRGTWMLSRNSVLYACWVCPLLEVHFYDVCSPVSLSGCGHVLLVCLGLLAFWSPTWSMYVCVVRHRPRYVSVRAAKNGKRF